MQQPSIDKLLSKADSKYSLVVAAAKRARLLMSGEEPKVDAGNHKPVIVALKEIEEGKIFYTRLKQSDKSNSE